MNKVTSKGLYSALISILVICPAVAVNVLGQSRAAENIRPLIQDFKLSQVNSAIDPPSEESIKGYMVCKKETSHEKLYNFGKSLAEGWAHWAATHKADEKRFPVKTKSDFITRAMTGLMEKYKITDNGNLAILYGCYFAYAANAKESPWSSVHSGLVDYLSPSLKSKFMSLPER